MLSRNGPLRVRFAALPSTLRWQNALHFERRRSETLHRKGSPQGSAALWRIFGRSGTCSEIIMYIQCLYIYMYMYITIYVIIGHIWTQIRKNGSDALSSNTTTFECGCTAFCPMVAKRLLVQPESIKAKRTRTNKTCQISRHAQAQNTNTDTNRDKVMQSLPGLGKSRH